MPTEAQESADNPVPNANWNESSRWPVIVALTSGIVAALLSVSLERSAYSFVGNSGSFITAALFPGLLGSMAIAGNVHAFSLSIAAAINFIFYFLVIWMICSFSRRVLHRFR